MIPKASGGVVCTSSPLDGSVEAQQLTSIVIAWLLPSFHVDGLTLSSFFLGLFTCLMQSGDKYRVMECGKEKMNEITASVLVIIVDVGP